MTRFRTSGNDRPWEIAKGYSHQSRQDLPLLPMRPEGEPSLLVGTAIVLAVFLLIATIAVLL